MSEPIWPMYGDEDDPAEPRTVSGAETACGALIAGNPCGRLESEHLLAMKICPDAMKHTLPVFTPRTPETQGVRIPEKWKPVYECHAALLDTDSLHICMLAEELGQAEARGRAVLGLLRVKHPGDVALAEEIIDEGGR